jgi:hypothetical protein
MNTSLKTQLQQIFDAVFFHSAEEYAIGGQRYPTSGLEGQLYGSCYSREFRVPLDNSFGQADPSDTLMLELNLANATRERWDYGWKITQILQDSSVYAMKEAQSRMLRPGEYMLQDMAAVAQPGAWIRAFLSKEDVIAQPGFYIVHPEIAPSFEDFQTLIRLYWNLEPEGAPKLLGLITERFNALRVPFQFKVLRYRSQYTRADSAVMFVGWRYAGVTLRLASEIYADVKKHLKPYTPLFARQLAPGLGLAEDPANGQSFGMSRCNLLAQAMVNAYRKRQQSHKARLSELRTLFEQAGLNLDNPHLSLSSIDHYDRP